MAMIIKSGLKANHALLKEQASYLPLLDNDREKGKLATFLIFGGRGQHSLFILIS